MRPHQQLGVLYGSSEFMFNNLALPLVLKSGDSKILSLLLDQVDFILTETDIESFISVCLLQNQGLLGSFLSSRTIE